MHSLLYRFALGCVEEKIIAEEELEWLVYGLEKRITTAITAIFFLLIGIHLADATSVIAFLSSFYFLRVRTNGYHANSFFGCLIISLLLEGFFLKLVLPALNSSIFFLLNIADFWTIFLFAPFTNRNMHLDDEELMACRKTSRIRISLLFTASMLLYTFDELNVSKGILLGNTMTALLLIIAYIKREKEKTKNEKRK